RPRRQRQRDFQQPLAAIRQFTRRLIAVIAKPELPEDSVGLLDGLVMGRKILPETAGEAAPLLDRQRYRFERAEMGKQRIDLERARQPAMHALLRLARGDVFLAEQDLSAV